MEVSANNAASSKKPLQRNMLHRPVLLIIQQKAQLLISRIHLSKQAIWKGRIVLSSQSGVAFLSVPHGWCHVYHTNRLATAVYTKCRVGIQLDTCILCNGLVLVTTIAYNNCASVSLWLTRLHARAHVLSTALQVRDQRSLLAILPLIHAI